VKLSQDDGRTWPVARSIEPGLSAYSDLAVGPDGTIYCFCEPGSASGAQYGHLCLARCNLAWLKGTEQAPPIRRNTPRRVIGWRTVSTQPAGSASFPASSVCKIHLTFC
jgi:hypothetical protein